MGQSTKCTISGKSKGNVALVTLLKEKNVFSPRTDKTSKTLF